jgi:hypothetical protein
MKVNENKVYKEKVCVKLEVHIFKWWEIWRLFIPQR